MHAINFLASLLAKENDVIKPQTIIKCLQFSLRFFEASKANQILGRAASSDNFTEASDSDNN